MKLTEQQIAHVKFLENERGQITPDLILADASREDSPLRELFEWDGDKAAHAYRIDQARAVIRTVTLIITTEMSTMKVPFYVRDPDIVKGQGYRSLYSLQHDAVAARQSLIGELTRAAGNITRARHLAVALNLSEDIDALMEQLLHVKQLVDITSVPPDTARPDVAPSA